MRAKEFECKVLHAHWITPSVLRIVFEPSKLFSYDPGQFLSLVVPSREVRKPLKRLYSFASSSEVAKKEGYEICVKYIPGGAGSEYVSQLRSGDRFKIVAPYGDFQYRVPREDRDVCFIGTGTGLSPIRSIVQSSLFQKTRPEKVTCLIGVRTQAEIFFRENLRAWGVDPIYAVSQPLGEYLGIRGRVSDYLRKMVFSASTDFYLCGNAGMIQEVTQILKARGVDERSIRKEAFSFASKMAAPNVFPRAVSF